MQHVLPELFPFDGLLGLAETTLLVLGDGHHFELSAAITNHHVFETFLLYCQGFDSSYLCLFAAVLNVTAIL